MTDAHATVAKKRGINLVWVVPIVAVALGVWMVIYTIQSQGPTITLQFSTAEGLEEGKTKVKLLNVDIGLVEDVAINPDLESVTVRALLEPEAERLLKSDTQFWVVRPRIGKGGVSGLGTLLSGGYIQVAPGKTGEYEEDFVGLEEPPVTPSGTPGIRVVITTENANSIGPGDAVLYKGYQVGRVETEFFDIEENLLRYEVFIDAPYSDQLTQRHRFWEVSGVSAKLGADGIQVDTGSLETVLFGGVEVGLPLGVEDGPPAQAAEVFKLYSSFDEVNERPYRYSLEYVVVFPQSVRGLLPGAPVEFRGLRMGQVERIMLTELTANDDDQEEGIPVLIRIEPARLDMPDSPEGIERMRETIRVATTENGMRATLATGNIITGSLFVTMDLFPGMGNGEMGVYADRPTIPTAPSGIEGITQKLTMFLDKLNGLNLDATVDNANDMIASIDALVAGPQMQQLPGTLDDAIAELRTTLASLSSESELQARLLPTITELERTLTSLRLLLDTLDEQPNSLIFNREYREDPQPRSGSQ